MERKGVRWVEIAEACRVRLGGHYSWLRYTVVEIKKWSQSGSCIAMLIC